MEPKFSLLLVLFLDLIGSSGFISFPFLLKKQLSSKFQFDIERTNTFCIDEILPRALGVPWVKKLQ